MRVVEAVRPAEGGTLNRLGAQPQIGRTEPWGSTVRVITAVRCLTVQPLPSMAMAHQIRSPTPLVAELVPGVMPLEWCARCVEAMAASAAGRANQSADSPQNRLAPVQAKQSSMGSGRGQPKSSIFRLWSRSGPSSGHQGASSDAQCLLKSRLSSASRFFVTHLGPSSGFHSTSVITEWVKWPRESLTSALGLNNGRGAGFIRLRRSVTPASNSFSASVRGRARPGTPSAICPQP